VVRCRHAGDVQPPLGPADRGQEPAGVRTAVVERPGRLGDRRAHPTEPASPRLEVGVAVPRPEELGASAASGTSPRDGPYASGLAGSSAVSASVSRASLMPIRRSRVRSSPNVPSGTAGSCREPRRVASGRA
jgi:hypothetical protein